jgi:hypothetical protein
MRPDRLAHERACLGTPGPPSWREFVTYGRPGAAGRRERPGATAGTGLILEGGPAGYEDTVLAVPVGRGRAMPASLARNQRRS